MDTQSETAGGKISSYLHAINNEEIPTNCNFARNTCSLIKYRSKMFTVSHRVSGSNLNRKCTSTNQSTNIARIFLLMSG